MLGISTLGMSKYVPKFLKCGRISSALEITEMCVRYVLPLINVHLWVLFKCINLETSLLQSTEVTESAGQSDKIATPEISCEKAKLSIKQLVNLCIVCSWLGKLVISILVSCNIPVLLLPRYYPVITVKAWR